MRAGATVLAVVACALSACASSSPPPNGSGAGGGQGSAGTGSGSAGSGVGTGAAGTGSGSAGAAGSGQGSAGATGAAGTQGTAGTMGAGGGGGTVGPRPCAVVISPISSGDFDDLAAGPTAKLRVRGDIVGAPQPMRPDWMWHVTLGSTGETVPVSAPSAQDPSVVEFPLARADRYLISVTVSELPFCGGNETATTTFTPTVSYRVRILPPRERGDLAPYEETIQSGQGMQRIFYFDRATSVKIEPQNASKQAVSSYVQITSAQHSWSREGDTLDRAFTTALVADEASLYDVLIVPTSMGPGAFAPLLFSGRTAARLSALPAVVDSGVDVSGSLVIDGGAAVAGATVLLRAGALPSTIGLSDSGGAFSLRARDGRFSAVIMPGAGAAPPPEAHVDADAASGIDLPASPSAPVTLAFTWRSDLPTRKLAAQLVGSDGAPAAGIEVRLESDAGSLPNVGQLRVTNGAASPQTFTATGKVRRTAVTSATGAVAFPDLPLASYLLTAAPPVSSRDGLTLTPVDLKAATPSSPLTVSLARKVTVSGTLSDAPAGTRILVLDDRPVPIPGHDFPAAAVGPTGAYTLALDPNHAYHLLADPPPGKMLSRVALGPLETGTVALSSGKQALPRMLAVTGRVETTNGGTTVAGAKLQLYCVGAGPDCVDPTRLSERDPLPLMETLTAEGGGYSLWVPDPTVSTCVLGQDQTCNDDPAVSSLHGHCAGTGTCVCNLGKGLNPSTGRCY